MENDELFRFFIERGVISTEERVKELEKRGWVKVTPEGFNDVCKEFAEKMKEKYPEIEGQLGMILKRVSPSKANKICGICC